MAYQLLLSSLILLIFLTGQSSQAENQTLSINEPVLTENVTYTNSRIIHQVDLRELYPNVTLDQEFDLLLAKTRASHNFKGKFNFVFENEKIYFLTTIPDPSILKLNVYLNSTLAPNENLKKVSRVFEIKRHQQKRIHVFKMNFINSMDEILRSERLILDEFQNRLWKGRSVCNDCLSIVHIKPDRNTYELAIASSQIHSDLIEEMCFLEQISKEYFNIAGLKVNPKGVQCYTMKVAANNQPVEEYTISAFINVRTRQRIMTRMFPLSLILGR